MSLSRFNDQFNHLSKTRMGDHLSGPAFVALQNSIKTSLELFPYALDDRKLAFVRNLGIEASPEATRPHPHPLHKTIENHLLYVHWRALATSPSTVMYMKAAKFEKLSKLNSNFVSLFNYIHTPKDQTRYLEQPYQLPQTETVFIHDAVMFMTFSAIHQLFESGPVTRVYASLILPPESILNLPSFSPTMYNYMKKTSWMTPVVDNRTPELEYFLEHQTTGSYRQPVVAERWLTTAGFKVEGTDYTITILESWGATHSLLITRGSAEPTEHTFKTPDIAILPQPVNVELPLAHRLVPISLRNQNVLYAKSVRTLRESDPFAQISRYAIKPEFDWVHSAAWENLAALTLQLGNIRTEINYNPFASPFDRLLLHVRRLLRHYRPGFLAAAISTIASSITSRFGLRICIGPFSVQRFYLVPLGYFAYLTFDFFNQTFKAQYRYERRVAALYSEPWTLTIPRTLRSETYRPVPYRLSCSPPTTPKHLAITFDFEEPQDDPVESPIPEAPAPEPKSTIQRFSFAELYPELCVDPVLGSFPMTRRDPSEPEPAYPETNCCLFDALAMILGGFPQDHFRALIPYFPNSMLTGPEELQRGFSSNHLLVLAHIHQVRFRIHVLGDIELSQDIGPVGKPLHSIYFSTNPDHWSDTYVHPQAPLRGSGLSPHAHKLKAFTMPDGSILPFLRVHKHRMNHRRASVLNEALSTGTDGVLAKNCSDLELEDHEAMEPILRHTHSARATAVDLVLIAGFAGCGKSHPLKAWLKQNPRMSYKVALPTVELLQEWKNDLQLNDKLQKQRVATWENALSRPGEVIIIDEIYKMPPGYLDLMLAWTPAAQLVILLGDPCQGSYHPDNLESPLLKLSPETDYLQRYLDVYCHWTHRLPQDLAKLLSVPTRSTEPGFIATQAHPIVPIHLVTSKAAARQSVDLGFRAMTMAASQGLTLSTPVALHMDRNVGALSKNISLVAATRSRRGLIFTGASSLLASAESSNTLFYSLANNIPYNFRAHFARELRNCHIIESPLQARTANELRGGALLLGPKKKFPIDYSLDFVHQTGMVKAGPIPELAHPDSSFLPPSRKLLHFEGENTLYTAPKTTSPTLNPAVAEAVYVGVDYQSFASTLFNSDKAYLDGERSWQNHLSNQFPQLDAQVLYGTSDPALVAPIHNSKHDETLLPLSIEKRLRFRATPRYEISDRDERIGRELFDAWLSLHHNFPPQPFDNQLFLDSLSLNDHSILQKKTQSTLVANAYRSAVDWEPNVVRIFTKQQHKINSNSLFTDWKAAQTLALMHDSVALLLGPVKKYQRHVFSKFRKSNVFVYGGNTPSQLADFCRSHMKDAGSVANDYTAFDQSQTGEAVVFERLKMQHLNIPAELIDFHVFLKTHTNTQLGPLTCMRLTGEPGTYDDNSDYNLAVLAKLFQITDQAVFVSGDDSCINPVPPVSPDWPLFGSQLALRFKLEFVNHPLFCGYFLGPDGIVRAPDALFVKAVLSETQKTLHKTLDSYIMDFALGHSLGNQLWQILPEEQWPYQDALFDFFCRKANPAQKTVLKLGLSELNGFYYQTHLIKLRTIKRHLLTPEQKELLHLTEIRASTQLLQ